MTVSLELENANAFAAWADVYDERQNPLLALEERYLLQLLPEIQGRDILDVGCGTGRWLAHLSHRYPRSLHGIDLSPEMLLKADAKHIPNARLSVSSCADLPVQDASIDVLLASFLLSYVDDLALFAKELARVTKIGSDLFLSDIHPKTTARLGWKRSFRNGRDEVELQTTHRKIADICAAFIEAGFVIHSLTEPAFGATERNIFAAHNKLDRFAEAGHFPAIYLLHLSKTTSSHRQNKWPKQLLLHGARCALGPDTGIAAHVSVHNSLIQAVSSDSFADAARSTTQMDLSGYLLLPGLINAHDHLEFALFPRLGVGPYKNAMEWALDIHQNDAATIALHRRIPKHIRLWWGGIRNLLCGVTTVCHHNQIDPLLLAKEFPVRILSRFGWEHSLPLAVDIQATHKNTPKDEPFIIHACEGIDEQSKYELLTLDQLAVLDQRTVLVHGLALDCETAALLNRRGGAVILCSSSNEFLFEKTPSHELLNSISKIALGSDSPLTAIGDLLDEIRFTKQMCAISPQQLYSLVTDSPASILRLSHGEGSIRPTSRADLIAVRDRQRQPADILCTLTAADIELVLLAGRVQLASESIFERLSMEDRKGLEPLSVDGYVRWIRAPISHLLNKAEEVLGKGAVRIGGKSVCRPN